MFNFEKDKVLRTILGEALDEFWKKAFYFLGVSVKAEKVYPLRPPNKQFISNSKNSNHYIYKW